MKLDIRIDDLSSEASQSIVREHMAGMLANTPIESVHALPLEKLRQPSITFWTAWMGSELCGCGALQILNQHHGEVKSMRTRERFLRQGVAQAVLLRIIDEAKVRGIKNLSLETGSSDEFSAARAMYFKNGFEICGPFADYQPDPLSVFMTQQL
jgi:putative acetyltransferase